MRGKKTNDDNKDHEKRKKEMRRNEKRGVGKSELRRGMLIKAFLESRNFFFSSPSSSSRRVQKIVKRKRN